MWKFKIPQQWQFRLPQNGSLRYQKFRAPVTVLDDKTGKFKVLDVFGNEVISDLLGQESESEESGKLIESGAGAGMGSGKNTDVGPASEQGVFFQERGAMSGMGQRVFQRDTLELTV